MMTLILACITAILALAASLFVLTSGRGVSRAFLFHFYERMGPELYGKTVGGWQGLIDEIVPPLSSAPAPKLTVLDVGTAVGEFPLALAATPYFTGRVVGIDWSPRMLQIAHHSAQERDLAACVEFSQADVNNGLPFASRAFDVIVVIGTLETLPKPEATLKEMVRVLKPDGRVMISCYRGWSQWSVGQVRDYYTTHLQKLGLTESRVVPFRPSHDLLIARRADVAD